MDACCTCATLLSTVPRHCAESEKPLPTDRRLECCARTICGNCIHVGAPGYVLATTLWDLSMMRREVLTPVNPVV